MHRRGPRLLAAVAVAALVCAAVTVEAQFRRGGFGFGARTATAKDFDGSFHFCRIVFRNAIQGDGGGWSVDYPRADINFSIRFSELTRTNVSFNAQHEPNHLLVNLGGPELFDCPVVILSAPGAVSINEAEGLNLRTYLLKGGFLWVDDFWGSYEWDHWVREIRHALPADQYPIFDIPTDHPIFRTQFEVREVPQMPNIGFWERSGGRTSEQGSDSAVPHLRAIADGHGRIVVLITHNTDIGDSWEREGDDPRYFMLFGPKGYALGINAFLYALTH